MLTDFCFIDAPDAVYVLFDGAAHINRHVWGTEHPTKTSFGSVYATRAVFLRMAKQIYGTDFAVI